jgi:hypothetical protein
MSSEMSAQVVSAPGLVALAGIEVAASRAASHSRAHFATKRTSWPTKPAFYAAFYAGVGADGGFFE